MNTDHENEVEVLKAIYEFDGFEDLRKNDAWKVCVCLMVCAQVQTPRAPHLRIRINPSHGASNNAANYVYAYLELKCADSYPMTFVLRHFHLLLRICSCSEPLIEVKNAHGLSDAQVQALRTRLVNDAQMMKGQVSHSKSFKNACAGYVVLAVFKHAQIPRSAQ
jgi:hypothetical protein